MEELKKRLIRKVVHLGQVVRRQRSEGGLRSVAPPTIYGYLAFLRMAQSLPHLSLVQVAQATLLGNANVEDREQLAGVFNEVFGLRCEDEGDTALGADLF